MIKNIFCWNSRGTATISFPRLCKEICSSFNVDMFIILEPRCIGEKVERIIKIGFDDSLRIEAQGFSDGV